MSSLPIHTRHADPMSDTRPFSERELRAFVAAYASTLLFALTAGSILTLVVGIVTGSALAVIIGGFATAVTVRAALATMTIARSETIES